MATASFMVEVVCNRELVRQVSNDVIVERSIDGEGGYEWIWGPRGGVDVGSQFIYHDV